MARLKGKEKLYYFAIVLSALICWSPFNILSYAAPPLVLIALLLLSREGRLLKRTIIWIYFWLVAIAIHVMLNSQFQLGNAIVALVTWAGLIIILIIPTHRIGSQQLYQRLQQVAWILLALEAVWGIVQGIYGYARSGTFDMGNGDYVEGTIHPSLEAEMSYSNVMFAINIAILLLFLLPSVWRRLTMKRVAVYSVGILAFVMASVVHAILFFTAAVGIAALLVYMKRLRLSRLVSHIATLGLIFTLALIFLPRNIGTAKEFARQIFRSEVPKSVSVIVALTELPRAYWYMPLIGLGPGQYASRAGLISTGHYFGGPEHPQKIPLLPNRFTESQIKYLLPLWQWHWSDPFRSSTGSPWSSWLAVYTEWGVLGLAVVATIILSLLLKIRKLPRAYDVEKLVLLASLIFVFLLGFQENNWEVPQAWFSGVLFLKVLYAYAATSSKLEGVSAERIFVAAHAADNDAHNREVSEEERSALRRKRGDSAVLYSKNRGD